MRFDGKRISKDTFMHLLDEGLPSIQNYEWMKDLIVARNYDPAIYNAPGCWKSAGRKFENCFCVINQFKDALVFRYFMIRILKYGTYFREICRHVVINGESFDIVNGRYWVSIAYEFRFTNEDSGWKYKKKSYYDNNYIGCERLYIDNVPELKYVKVMLERATSLGFSNIQIQSTINSYRCHPKYEILWKANGDKLGLIGHIDQFSNKKLTFIGKHQLEQYFEVVWCYDIYDPEFVRKIQVSSKLEKLINILEEYGISKYRLANFIKKQDTFDCEIYMDYLKNLKDLNIDVKKAAFPEDYEEEHTRLSMHIQYLKREPEIKKYSSEYIATAKHLTKLERTGKYSILIPSKLEDFLREGTFQKICVFANGYYKAVIKHQSIILFVRKNEEIDRPYVCVELGLDFNIVQARGFANKSADAEVTKYLNEVVKDYQKEYINLDNFWKMEGVNYARV